MILKRYSGIFLIVSAIAAGCISCSGNEDEYSFPPMVYDEKAYLDEIAAAGDLITLNETRANYAVALKKSAKVDSALRRKWEELSEKIKTGKNGVKKLSDEIELWSFDFEKIGPRQWRLYFLFRATGKMDENYGITVSGRLPDPSRLSEPWQEKGYRWWHFNPLPPTRFWEKGEFVVVREDITAPDLPFRLRMNFDTPDGRYGRQVRLGIFRKIGDMAVTEEEIRRENDPFQLDFWCSCSHARSGPKGDLVRKRFEDVTGELEPSGVPADGIEYYGARLSRQSSGFGRIKLLFRLVKPVNRDYWLTLYGMVAPEDVGSLSPARRKAGKSSEKWYFPPYPPSSDWPVDDFMVVVHNITAAPVEYDLFGFLYDRQNRKPGPRFEVGVLKAASEE